MKLSLETIFALCLRHYFTPEAAATMAAIALAESGGDTLSDCIDCVPGVHEASLGLFQINVLAHPEYPPTCLHDPDCAANAAYILSNRGGDFTPWSTYNNGAYKRFYVPPESIIEKGGTATVDNPVQQALKNKLAGPQNLYNALTGAGPSTLSNVNYENAAIAGIVAVVAIAMVFFGIYGLVKGEAERVVLAAGKVA